MTEFASTQVIRQDSTLSVSVPSHSTRQLVERIKRGWQQHQLPDLASILRENPSLQSQRSAVIELAVEEYKQLRSRNQLSDIQQYCQGFVRFGSALYSSVFRQIEVERYLDDHPSLRLQEEEIDWPVVGQRIGGFQLLEELGRGALARVYLCLQSDLGDRQVVVKVSRSGTLEAKTLGKLRHPHIMPVHSLETLPGDELCYLCTPFLGRSTLHDLLSTAFVEGPPRRASVIQDAARIWITSTDRFAEGPKSSPGWRYTSYVNGVLKLAVKLTDALAHAHAAGILHGDLKPSNILLTAAGEPMLLDFNLAHDDSLELRAGGGTLPYMSPEQILHLFQNQLIGDERLDARSEIYSLGVVVYELLCGKLPFDVDSRSAAPELSESLLSQQREGPRSMAALKRLAGTNLANVVHRCLAYDPDQRFQSMDTLRTALLKEAGHLRQLVRWAQTHRYRFTAMLLSTVLITTGLGWWYANRPPYYMRQYQAGTVLLHEGKLEEALAAFERSADDHPDYVEAQFAVARTYVSLGQTDLAMKLFADLIKMHKHPPSMVYMAYCFNLSQYSAPAIYYYQMALDAGYATGEVHNNMYASLERGRTEDPVSVQRARARRHLLKALELLPASPTVQFNAVVGEIDHAQRNPGYVPRMGLRQFESLLDGGHQTREVYLIAQVIYRLVGETDPFVLDRAMDVLIDGCKRGVDLRLDEMKSTDIYRPFVEHPKFSQLESISRKHRERNLAPSFTQFLEPSPWPSD